MISGPELIPALREGWQYRNAQTAASCDLVVAGRRVLRSETPGFFDPRRCVLPRIEEHRRCPDRPYIANARSCLPFPVDRQRANVLRARPDSRRASTLTRNNARPQDLVDLARRKMHDS